MKLNKIALASFLGLLSCASFAEAQNTTSTYNNFYVAYMSPADVASAVTYAKSKGVNRFFMWTVDQDAPASSTNSLIGAVNSANKDASIATYFANYASYNNQRAIPGPSYTISGSAADLNPKLNASNELIYSFLETQVPAYTGAPAHYINTPHSYGSVYLFDPWSDLAPGDTFCGKANLPVGVPVDGNGYNLICGYAFDNQGKSYTNTADYNHYGNFEAFAALPATIDGKTSAPIQTSFSIGGYGHNATFEAIFDPSAYGVTTVSSAQATDNFVNSIVTLMTQYNLDGIDLDYENVQMTLAQSQAYFALISALNAKLQGLNKFITIAIISNPDYIAGTENNNTIGFAPGILKSIAGLSQVKAVDAMTYDFSGNFDYGDGSHPGTTGFLSNVYPPNDANTPSGYNFSIQYATEALLKAGVPAAKIGIGIPAYGRALANLSGGENTYLFAPLNGNVVVPAGDQDNAGCDEDIKNWQSQTACQGMFSYNLILNKIVGQGVTATDHQDNSGNQYNGSTAFGNWTPPATPIYTLTIVNENASSGQVSLGSWSSSSWLATGTYNLSPENTPGLSAIEGESGLAARFTYWGGTVNCATANFTSNLKITINQGSPVTCSVTNT